ncbi:MAG: DNA glycosylase [Clostridia bacterium]
MEKFEIAKSPTFDIKQTLDCGQVFRYVEHPNFTDCGSKFTLFAGSHCAEITDCGESYNVLADESNFFWKYLDFDTKYDIIQLNAQDKGLVSSAIEFGRGIHILRQDTAETVFSFLISQNNHIPRIKAIIERMCAGLGEKMDGYFAFPTIDKLAGAGEKFFAEIGAGYRASYLDRTAKALRDIDIECWRLLDTDTLRANLMKLHGVGRKVADCILLFGFRRFDVFPVDTWIAKIYEEEYPSVPPEKLSKMLVEKYGDLSGFVQQWLFYYKRQKSIDKS